MQKQHSRYLHFFILSILFAGLACNLLGGEEETPTPEPEAATATPEEADTPTPQPGPPTATPEEPTPEPASGAVSSLDDLESAVVQIVAEGSFVDPEFGLQLNAPGTGSGFIIDEEGLAVTNNHVVTGAALLKVYVAGESQPKNARVLAVSECSDLALIDIEGEGYPYLEWYEDDITTGLQIYVAGFPLGDPEFTLTSGIISKANADGETTWSSADSVIEYDAPTNPGNSGGPVVTADAKVVGVHYAGIADFRQQFAIAHDEALEILDQLKAEIDVTSIGVNGFAVSDGENYGIWVSSVESGSPADRAGLQGGDIITRLEGLLLATDGTMSDYCDILRSHKADDVLSIEILRYATEEILAGQLNGDELAVVFSFAQELDEQIGEGSGDEATFYEEFVEVVDDTGTLVMEVPAPWAADVDGAPLLNDDGSVSAASIAASSDLNGFFTTYATPGVLFEALETGDEVFDMGLLLDNLERDYECVYDGRYEYDDGLYVGLYDLYVDCGNVGSIIIELAAEPESKQFFTYLLIQAISDADLDALDHILNTFYVIEE